MSAAEAQDLPTSFQLIPVNKQAVEELKQQRELLGDFVRSQLREADFSNEKSPSYGEGDYGVIPGTKKKCLFKQGAEKLLRLFGLGVRVRLADKELDKGTNFALYTYRAEVYVLKTGIVVAECEATANSQEVKYKERTKWATNANGVRVSTKEETPIFDVINTLQKMSQKRAIIGATILATAASEYFTQDVLEPEDLKPSASGAPNPNAKPETKDVPNETQGTPPICHDKPMMVSKYVDEQMGHAPWYCMTCKAKKARQ